MIEDTKEAESEQWTDAVENQTEPPGTKNNKPKDIFPLIYSKTDVFWLQKCANCSDSFLSSVVANGDAHPAEIHSAADFSTEYSLTTSLSGETHFCFSLCF